MCIRDRFDPLLVLLLPAVRALLVELEEKVEEDAAAAQLVAVLAVPLLSVVLSGLVVVTSFCTNWCVLLFLLLSGQVCC